MVSDTAKAKQAVLEFLRERGQGTSSELIEAIRVVLGDHFTEGKAAGAIRMCVEDGRSGVYRLDRGVYAYQPAEVTARCADAGEAADAAPAGKSPRSRNTRRKAHRHTPRSQKAV